MKRFRIIIYAFLLLFARLIAAQTDTTQIKEFTRDDIIRMTYDDLLALPFDQLVTLASRMGVSIDELLKMKTSVASKTALTPRETPGIVSIITEEEIKTSGSRDLIDVLRLVPGISFGYDDAGVVGIQMRGNWAHEGKVLLIIDGIEFNDLKYNNHQFGRHFDINQIKKIEIIRGPGSSIYGGNAEMGVINITTKKATDVNGVDMYASSGLMEKTLGHWDAGIAIGKKLNDWEMDFKSFVSSGNRTDQTLKLENYDLGKHGAETGSLNFNLGIKRKNFSSRFIYDNYMTTYVYADDSVSYSNTHQYFKTLSADFKYDINIGKKIVITPKLNLRNGIPYYEAGWYQNTSIYRYTGNITAQYDVSKHFSMVGGSEYFYDYGKMIEKTDSSFFDSVKRNRSISFNTLSFFWQGIIKTNVVNVIAGGRFDSHNEFGSAFAPRIGVTRAWNKFHFKALYSGAFRSPSIGNLLFDPSTKPEKTYVAELELGYKLNNNMFLTTNIFDIRVNNPIIFYYDTLAEDYMYISHGKTGSMGFEVEYQMKYTWGFAKLNYSYNRAQDSNVSEYRVSANDNYLVGSPAHKVALHSSFNLNKHLFVSPTLTYIGKRYYSVLYKRISTFRNFKTDPDLLINLFVSYRNLFIRKLELSVGVFDLLNTKSVFIQSYNGIQLPYPGPSREFVAKLTYHFSLGKE